MSELASPPGVCLLFLFFSLLQQTMDDYMSFPSDTSKWEQVNMATWGSLDICLLLTQFQVVEITRTGLSAISHAEVWEDPKRPTSDMAYLLPVADQVVEEERRFRLVAVWTHPCQAHLPSLVLLMNTGEDWAYAFMQLNTDSQDIPLSTARHISTIIDGALSRSTCGHLSHLEVHKLLQCGVKVVYPEGLHGGLELPKVSIPKPPIWDSDSHMESSHKPILLQVNLPRIVPQWSSTPISSLHSVTECPSNMVPHPHLTMEIEELLSIKMPDNLEQPPHRYLP